MCWKVDGRLAIANGRSGALCSPAPSCCFHGILDGPRPYSLNSLLKQVPFLERRFQDQMKCFPYETPSQSLIGLTRRCVIYVFPLDDIFMPLHSTTIL